MKTFVTGGAGSIGTHLVRKLREQGYEVTVYDKVNGDNLLSHSALDYHIRGHEFVWHLAANADTRKALHDPQADFDNNIVATYNLLEAMRKSAITAIAFTSSATVYGDLASALPVDEHTSLEPISVYGASKVACEALINAYQHTFGFRAWVYRMSNIIGPGTKIGVVYDLINKLKENPKQLQVLGDGTQERSFLRVEDCVEALLAKKKEGTYNIGNSDALTVGEIVQIITEEMKVCPYEISYAGGERGWRGDAPVVHLDTSKIRLTGWRPSCSSEEVVRRTVRELIA